MTVKKLRKKSAEYLAQLLIDQEFYKIMLNDNNEDELRNEVALLKKEQTREKERIESKMKMEKRKGEKPTEEELKKFSEITNKIVPLEAKINKFNELRTNRARALDTIDNVRLILNIIDSMPRNKKRELNKI